MARRPSKHLKAPRPLTASQNVSKRTTSAGVYLMRHVPAARALKTYVCPGCHSPIQPGVAHIVAWPEEPRSGMQTGLEERRHWHSHCWRLNR